MQGPESNTPEVVCQWDAGKSITSGGGFSNYYKRPSWQDSSVATYYTNMASSAQVPAAGYNRTGRGFPDLALAGYGYTVRTIDALHPTGVTVGMAGTSASCPVAAAMFTNINAARLAAGKGPVGWVNPALYAHAASFVKDVVSGDNRCASNGKCCPQGFYATPGWDPASGLGSVNYSKLQAKFLSIGVVNSATPPPTMTPTIKGSPTTSPTSTPTLRVEPTQLPTVTPSVSPTPAPTLRVEPTQLPTVTPSVSPTPAPTLRVEPTQLPSSSQPLSPSFVPSLTPSSLSRVVLPTLLPYQRRSPVRTPTLSGTTPSFNPSFLPGYTSFPTSTNLKRMASKQPAAQYSPTAAPTSGRVSSVQITQVG